MSNSLTARSNFENWCHFMEPAHTHEHYKTIGFYWMIAAALERRVWLDSSANPTYPNLYVLLVAKAGGGKSSVTSPVKKIITSIHETAADAPRATVSGKKLLFKLAADSTSYESFVEFTSKAYKIHRHGDGNKQTYHYSAPMFILDEASSIFHKHAEDMATFLLSGWMCEDRYMRTTIGRGDDAIENICVNLIGGIQPGKFVDISKVNIIDNGFSRRCIMVYVEKQLYDNPFIEHTAEQIAARDSLIPHVKKLNKLYGNVTMSDEAREWFNHWYKTGYRNPINKATCLDNYYDTKHQQLKKLAMAVHFSERLDMVVEKEDFIRALEILEKFEPSMHLAFAGERDVRGEVIGKLKSLLKSEPDGLTAMECYPDIVDICDLGDFNDLLVDLSAAGILTRMGDKYKLVGKQPLVKTL